MSTDPCENTAPDNPAEEAIPPIPRRPLTTYNIFSIMERHYILQHCQKTPETEIEMEIEPPADQTADPYLSTRPAKYRHIILPPNWYVVGKNRKTRQQHKNHGLISFNLLNKMISDAWAEADEETKAYCKRISSDELVRYRAEQKAFKEKYGEEAFEAQTRKRLNAEMGGKEKKKRKKMAEESARVEDACDPQNSLKDKADDQSFVQTFDLGGFEEPSSHTLETREVPAYVQESDLEGETNTVLRKEGPIFQDRFVRAFGLGRFERHSTHALEMQLLDQAMLNRARDIQIMREKVHELQLQQKLFKEQTLLWETTLARKVTPEDESRSKAIEKSAASGLLSFFQERRENKVEHYCDSIDKVSGGGRTV